MTFPGEAFFRWLFFVSVCFPTFCIILFFTDCSPSVILRSDQLNGKHRCSGVDGLMCKCLTDINLQHGIGAGAPVNCNVKRNNNKQLTATAVFIRYWKGK